MFVARCLSGLADELNQLNVFIKYIPFATRLQSAFIRLTTGHWALGEGYKDQRHLPVCRSLGQKAKSSLV